MADLKRIDLAHQAMSEHMLDHERYAESDVAFHLAVFDASHNVLLRRFGYLVADFLRLSFDMQQKALLQRDHVPDFSEDADRHRLVYEYLNRAEPERAAEAMLEVILDGKRNLIDAVDSLAEREQGKK